MEGGGREAWMMDEEREEREGVYARDRGREMKGGRVHVTQKMKNLSLKRYK